MLYDKGMKKIIAYPGGKKDQKFIIPKNTEDLGDQAFRGCRYLISIEIPNSVTSIGKVVFANCGSLTSIEIPNSVFMIGNRAFSGSPNLKEIHLHNEHPEEMIIGEEAFYGIKQCTLFVPIGTGYAYRHDERFRDKFKEIAIDR